MDPDVLALLALGEDAGGSGDHAHLEHCAECRLELRKLGHTADVGRSTLDAGELLEPSPRVWAAIQAELRTSSPELASEPRPIVELAPIAPLRRRWVRPLIGAAAAVALVAGLGGTWWVLTPSPRTVLAAATLDAFPDWVGSEGTATVEELADGARVIEVTLAAPVSDDGFREVWLISSDSSQLVSLGIMGGDGGSFTIPDGLDLDRFDLVDISEEPYDGDPDHSGDSIVRGELARA